MLTDASIEVNYVLQEPEERDGNPLDEAGDDDEVQTCQNKPFAPRKRQRHESRRAKAKRLRSLGEKYINVKGNVVPAKNFQNINCMCLKQCSTKITEEERKKQFDKFNKIGDFGKQNAYLCGLVHQTPVVQRRPRSGERGNKDFTNVFHVNNGDCTVRVCKKYFLQTFVVSDGRVTRATKKVAKGNVPGEDLRGKHVAAKKITEEQTESVMDHIRRFPAFQSH